MMIMIMVMTMLSRLGAGAMNAAGGRPTVKPAVVYHPSVKFAAQQSLPVSVNTAAALIKRLVTAVRLGGRPLDNFDVWCGALTLARRG